MKLELAEERKPINEQQNSHDIPVNWVSIDEAEKLYLNRGFGNSYDFQQIV